VPRNDRLNDTSAAAIGRALRGVREAASISQQEVASAAEMDRAYLSEVESGKRSLSVDRLLRICHALNLAPTQVMSEIEQQLQVTGGAKRLIARPSKSAERDAERPRSNAKKKLKSSE
jgi:transcriptional regulator with XRE-family HTH domain